MCVRATLAAVLSNADCVCGACFSVAAVVAAAASVLLLLLSHWQHVKVIANPDAWQAAAAGRQAAGSDCAT